MSVQSRFKTREDYEAWQSQKKAAALVHHWWLRAPESQPAAPTAPAQPNPATGDGAGPMLVILAFMILCGFAACEACSAAGDRATADFDWANPNWAFEYEFNYQAERLRKLDAP